MAFRPATCLYVKAHLHSLKGNKANAKIKGVKTERFIFAFTFFIFSFAVPSIFQPACKRAFLKSLETFRADFKYDNSECILNTKKVTKGEALL